MFSKRNRLRMRSSSASRGSSPKRNQGKASSASKMPSPGASTGKQLKGFGAFSKHKTKGLTVKQEEMALLTTYTYSTQTDLLTDAQSNNTALTAILADPVQKEKSETSDCNQKSLASVTSITSYDSANVSSRRSVKHRTKDNLPSFKTMYCNRCHYFYDQHLKELADKYTVLPENNAIFNELIMNCKLEYSKSWKGQIVAYISLLYLVGFVVVISICCILGLNFYAKFINSFDACNILPNTDYVFDAGKLLELKKLPSPERISIIYGKYTGLGSVDIYHCTKAPGPVINFDGSEEHRPLSYLLSFSSAITSVNFSLAGNGIPASVNLYANTLVSRNFPFSEKICILRTNNFEEILDDSMPVIPLTYENCITLQSIMENQTTIDFRPLFHCDNTMGCNYKIYLDTNNKYRDVLLDLHLVLDFTDIDTRDCKYIGLESTEHIQPKSNNFLLIKRRNGSNLVRDTIVVTFHYTNRAFILAIITMSLIAIAILILFVYTLKIAQWRFYMKTINKVLDDYISNKQFKKEVMEAKAKL